MEDAGDAIDGKRSPKQPVNTLSEEGRVDSKVPSENYETERTNNYNRRKRKSNSDDSRMQHGSRKGGRNDNKRHKKGDLGRGEYFRNEPDKRQKAEASRSKRQEGSGPQYGKEFSKEEIDAEERKPKRKVAVMIGYSGTGYKGMQISPSEKTIEGDLFNAFIAAGAISKANADDPKKASLVRCARTDKGVHAAGNMISLKLIMEDDNIVEKINQNLSPQIRVWGIERTIGSFSCYQACDSRWYEYLIPSHAFLPPHPSSWLAKKLEQYADDAGDREGYDSRQAEVQGFWEKVDEEAIKPVLETIDEDIRYDVIKALQGEDEADAKVAKDDADAEQPVKAGRSLSNANDDIPEVGTEKTADAAIVLNEPGAENGSVKPEPSSDAAVETGVKAEQTSDATADGKAESATVDPTDDKAIGPDQPAEENAGDNVSPEEQDRQQRIRAATKTLRLAYNTAKRRYRIPAQRIERIQAALSKFVGTANYHNYTIQKTYKDPSAKRHIKSFVVNRSPILIGADRADEDKSEWLSMKVHGQSFMMHQIRKMIGMVTLLVRGGADLQTLDHSLGSEKFSIPKVPGLGLLLERPVFDSYNSIQAVKHGREKLEFGKYDKDLEAFKQREIYQRIFREEEERNEFAKFFNHVDNFKEAWFLFVTSKGLEATRGVRREGGSGGGGAGLID